MRCGEPERVAVDGGRFKALQEAEDVWFMADDKQLRLVVKIEGRLVLKIK